MDINLSVVEWFIVIVVICLFAIVAFACLWHDLTIDEDDDNMGNEAAHPSRCNFIFASGHAEPLHKKTNGRRYAAIPPGPE